MKKTEKTILEWWETLPEGYRGLAIKYYDPNYHDGLPLSNLSDAILETCHWRSTPEGLDFWNAVYEWSRGRGELPPLPRDKK